MWKLLAFDRYCEYGFVNMSVLRTVDVAKV